MNDRERFISCVLGQEVDRPPYYLFWGPWATTWRRWQSEGKPAAITDHRSFFNPDQPPLAVPVNCGPCPKIERTVLEENTDYVTFTDTWGIKRRDYKHGESMSEFLEFPVKDRRDWEKFKEERLNPDDPERLGGDWRERCARWEGNGWPIQLGYYPDVGIFGIVRWLLGDEEGLVGFYTMPDLIHDIMEHMTSLYLTVYEKVVREVRVDVVHLWQERASHFAAALARVHGPTLPSPEGIRRQTPHPGDVRRHRWES
jgi:uroporphyrinogen decarboxylase